MPIVPQATCKPIQREDLARLVEFIGNQGFQVGIGDDLLLICQALEAFEGFIQLCLVHREAQFVQAGLEGMPAGMFAQHQAGLGHAHRFGAHDLIGLVVLEHAVLVDAGFMGKGIGAHDGFIGLDRRCRCSC